MISQYDPPTEGVWETLKRPPIVYTKPWPQHPQSLQENFPVYRSVFHSLLLNKWSVFTYCPAIFQGLVWFFIFRSWHSWACWLRMKLTNCGQTRVAAKSQRPSFSHFLINRGDWEILPSSKNCCITCQWQIKQISRFSFNHITITQSRMQHK